MTLLLFAAAEAEPSKLAFYLSGAILVVWALAVAGLGIARRDFPATKGASRGVIGISVMLVATTLASVLLTS